MQAGESLSFIAIPEELATPETLSDDERAFTAYHYYHLVKGMLARSKDIVRSLERPAESGTVFAREASFQVPFNDGSYLYLVAYGHEYENEYLDLGFSITEHSDEGDYLGGYSFELVGADLRYSTHHSPSLPTDDSYEVDRKYHFSLLDQYEHKDALDFLILAGDEETRQQAEDEYDAWKVEIDLALISKDVGLSWREPSPEDILTLKELANLASPFKVEQH